MRTIYTSELYQLLALLEVPIPRNHRGNDSLMPLALDYLTELTLEEFNSLLGVENPGWLFNSGSLVFGRLTAEGWELAGRELPTIEQQEADYRQQMAALREAADEDAG